MAATATTSSSGVGPKSDCGAGIDTFAAPDALLRLGRVRAGCELASPDLEDQLDTADPTIVVDSVRVRRGRLEIAFVSDEAKSRRIDVELFKRGQAAGVRQERHGCAAASAG